MNTRFLTASILALVTAMPVMAQEGGLEEVVVTAQRREQSLQEVPVSVTAFTGDTLDNLNITDAAQYLQLSPNVSFTEDGQTGSRGISIAMRGVSNINTDESAFIQSIGIYLDEFSVASTANSTINPQLLDLERVEVLRGPQGTFFGRNSVGGALNLQTKKPTDVFGWKINAGGQGYETRGSQYDVSGIINLPITDTLMARGVILYEDNSGIVKNIVPNGGDSGHDYIMGRAAVRWLPTDNTTVDWMFMYSDENQGLDEAVPSGVWDTDTVATFFLNNPALGTPTQALDDGTGFWPNNRDKVAHTAIGEKNDNRALLSVLNLQHEFSDGIVVKSISGLIDTKNEKIFDNDLVPEDIVNRFEEKNGNSWSTELRVEVTRDRFDWVSGFMYSEDKVTKDVLSGAPGDRSGVVTGVTTAVNTGVSLDAVPGGNPDVPIVGPGLVDFALINALPPLFNLAPNPATFFLYNLTPDGQLPLCLSCGVSRKELNSWALFSDFTWHANERFDLTFGFRYTEDSVDARYIEWDLFRFIRPGIRDPADPTNLTAIPIENDDTFEDFSPRFVLGWQITDDMRLYGTISKGYKAGGFSLDYESDTDAVLNQKFGKETLWNYEIGVKSEWFDNRLRLNASAFHLEWTNLQLETFFFAVVGDPTSNVQRTINVEAAEASGFEVEFASAITDQLTVSGGLGHVETEMTSNDFATISGGHEVSLQGEPLPRSPEWTWSMMAEYRWPWDTNELYVRGEWIYRDHQFSTIEDVTYLQSSGNQTFDDAGNLVAVVPDRTDGFPFVAPDYHVVNLRAGMIWQQNWELNVFINNVFDEDYYTGTGENFGLSGFRLKPHPRYFGGSVSYSFGGI